MALIFARLLRNHNRCAIAALYRGEVDPGVAVLLTRAEEAVDYPAPKETLTLGRKRKRLEKRETGVAIRQRIVILLTVAKIFTLA